MRYANLQKETFKDIFLKRFSQKKWDDFENLVIKLCKDCLSYKFNKDKTSVYECEEYNKVMYNANCPDYAQIIGVMQGVCYYGLGYKDLGAINIETTPRYWLEQIEHHLGIEEYKDRKAKGLLPKKKKV
jgi:hypothetical protein